MIKKSPRKPTGEIKTGYLEVGGGKGSNLLTSEAFKLPEIKNDAEDVVMQKFVAVSKQSNNAGLVPVIAAATHFQTDHGPDFEVLYEDGSRGFFELFEIAPLKGRYEDATTVMLVGDLVQFVVEHVRDKINNYSAQPAYRPISLLLYVSHYAFEPRPVEAQCMQAALRKVENQVFEAIYLELFAHDGNPLIVKLWPVVGHIFTKSEFTAHMRRQLVRPDPSRARIMEDASDEKTVSVVVRQYMPLGVDLSKFRPGDILTEEAAARLGLTIRVRTRN